MSKPVAIEILLKRFYFVFSSCQTMNIEHWTLCKSTNFYGFKIKIHFHAILCVWISIDFYERHKNLSVRRPISSRQKCFLFVWSRVFCAFKKWLRHKMKNVCIKQSLCAEFLDSLAPIIHITKIELKQAVCTWNVYASIDIDIMA